MQQLKAASERSRKLALLAGLHDSFLAVGSELEVWDTNGMSRPVTSPAIISFVLTDPEGDLVDYLPFAAFGI